MYGFKLPSHYHQYQAPTLNHLSFQICTYVSHDITDATNFTNLTNFTTT